MPSTLSEAAIRRLASSDVFQRGHDYFRSGAVGRLTRRGDLVQAEVEGSGYAPYQVRVVLTGAGVGETNCTCPYDWGGACKHVVATLLALANAPEQVEERPPLEALLGDLDLDQLRALIVDLVRDHPDLAAWIETHPLVAGSPQIASTDADALPRARTVPLNPEAFRADVRAAFHSVSRMRSSDAYWAVPSVVGDVFQVANRARPFLDAGDGRGALTILEAVTEEYLGNYMELDDSDGEASGLLPDLDPLWAEAILVAGLTPRERRAWAKRFAGWAAELQDYGIEDAFLMAEAAAVQGWDDPAVVRMLKGEAALQPPRVTVLFEDAGDEDEESDDEWEEDEDDDEDDEHEEPEDEPAEGRDFVSLTPIRLAVLERQGRTEEYLNLATATGRIAAYLIKLVDLGRIEEAVRDGLERLAAPGDALAVAEALLTHGATDEALRVAERGLSLPDPDLRTIYVDWGGPSRSRDLPALRLRKADLAVWLRELAAGHDRPDLALTAALAAVREQPSLENYVAARDLAGDRWSALRDEALADLRRMTGRANHERVDIFVHERLIDDAIRIADGAGYDPALVETVARAALASHPGWVFDTALGQANPIMDEGRSGQYEDAARWLSLARDAAREAGRGGEWRAYIDGVIARHARKYKLMPLIRPLKDER